MSGNAGHDPAVDADGPSRSAVVSEPAAAPDVGSDESSDGAQDTTPDGPGRRRLTLEERVLRAFIRDDRLVSIPAREQKRLIVLRHLRDRCFPEDRVYPEGEVNQRLALWHRDVAALRRGMVDAGLMTRASGEYRRTGPRT